MGDSLGVALPERDIQILESITGLVIAFVEDFANLATPPDRDVNRKAPFDSSTE